MRFVAVRLRSAFTLLEVLLVLALIGSAASVFVISIDSIARTTPADSLEGAFWASLRDAREAAMRTRRVQRITFNPDDMQFVVEGGGNVRTENVDLEGTSGSDKFEAVFKQVLPSNTFTLIRGRLVTEREITSMLVFPDGTCQPVTVEFRFPGGTRRLPIDPWTCAELIDGDEEDGG
ncbi:MAG TPA: prepilin-type N-terminal cleavage/methylation domain-containing protein [Opitutaceae bacterium]|nr:prepilin-type N-terminal cleavage/methylation domain-containing protein [Opitutaceae bacterium]